MLKNKVEENKRYKEAQLLLKHIERLSKYSYELEEKREQSLIDQSSKMLEAFSVITAAMGILLSIVLQYIPNLSKYFVFTVTGIVGFFLLNSLVLAILAQWRYKYKTLPLPNEIYKHVHDNYRGFLDIRNQSKHYISLLNDVQQGKKNINDKRVKIITWSMIFFYCSIITFSISIIIAINVLIYN